MPSRALPASTELHLLVATTGFHPTSDDDTSWLAFPVPARGTLGNRGVLPSDKTPLKLPGTTERQITVVRRTPREAESVELDTPLALFG